MPTGVVQVRIVQNRIAQWGDALRAVVAAQAEASANRVLEAASANAPVRTGELAASGQVHQVSASSFTVTFGEGLDDMRAIAQELGTSRHPAQPYLYPALQAEKSTFLQAVAAATGGKATGFRPSTAAEINVASDPLSSGGGGIAG